MINKMKLNVIAGVLVVFIAGMVLGGLVTTGFLFNKMRHFAEGSGTIRHRWLMLRMSRELDLTAEQKPRIQRILTESEQEMMQLLQRSLTEFAAIMKRQRADLKTVLTPEQQAKFDQTFERFRSHWMPKMPPEE